MRVLDIGIMRHVQVFQHLLGDALEHRRANLAALMQSDGRVENHGDGYCRAVDR